MSKYRVLLFLKLQISADVSPATIMCFQRLSYSFVTSNAFSSTPMHFHRLLGLNILSFVVPSTLLRCHRLSCTSTASRMLSQPVTGFLWSFFRSHRLRFRLLALAVSSMRSDRPTCTLVKSRVICLHPLSLAGTHSPAVLSTLLRFQ